MTSSDPGHSRDAEPVDRGGAVVGSKSWGTGDLTGGSIDEVFVGLRKAFSDLRIERLTVTRPADDDNVWFISRPGHDLELQIDSMSDGAPPFLLESHNGRMRTDDVREAIAQLTEWLHF